MHSLLDGLALTAAVLAGGDTLLGLAGFGAALVVILHKPFDALAALTLMRASGCGVGLRRTVNVAFALVAPVGAALALAGLGQFTETHRMAVGCALAFCGGGFLCIAGSDLLPVLHFHSHDQLRLSLALAAGLGVAEGIGWLEHHGHDHDRHYDHHHHEDHDRPHGVLAPPVVERLVGGRHARPAPWWRGNNRPAPTATVASVNDGLLTLKA